MGQAKPTICFPSISYVKLAFNARMKVVLHHFNINLCMVLFSLAQRETAIVSSIAGTTRDVIEKAMDIGGYPVMISDTAGLRENEDVIEKEGVQRALQR